MADTVPFYAYKETRLNLDHAIQGSTVAVRLPSHGAPTWSSRTSQKRSHTADIGIAEDEGSFRQKHLATAASIFHRTFNKSPRSFLWRILEDGKVLSIRAVDVSRQHNAADANLTLRLILPSPIRPGCIAFSDSKEHDVLSTFVLTESNHLYTLSLRPDFLKRNSSIEDNVGDWCKSYLSSAFAFKTPHRLVDLSADNLLVSLYDGGLLRLSRISGGDGSDWKETFYHEGGWGQGLRSLMPFQGNHTVRFGKSNMELSAATSIASPAINIYETPYVFTVSLDHRLRIWNLGTGKIAHMGDLLNQELDSTETRKNVIDPSYSQLVKVVVDNDENVLCATYSPVGTGQFKIWKVSQAEHGNLDLTDLFTDNVLEPRAPTSDLWTLADFSLLLHPNNKNKFTLWTLWKNNITYRVQKLDFTTGSTRRVKDIWSDDWVATATETLVESPLPAILQGDPSDGTDKWLEYILFPGRFTAATIETGLAIYERGLGVSKDVAVHRSGNLAERLCSLIASTTTLDRSSDGHPDYEQFRAATDAQWRRFYRLLIELNKQRGEALSLVIDPQGEMPWVILSDGISAIRDCSNLEQMWHNPDNGLPGTKYIAALITAAATLRDTFSDQLIYSCNAILLAELFDEPSKIDPVRMRSFYDKCDFISQIGDEDYAQLVHNLGGGFKNVTPEVFETLLELMTASESTEKRPHLLPLAEFGNKLIVKGVQETVELHRNVCLDQLILLIFIEAEINHQEDGIQFETAAVFRQLLVMLKRLELIGWLAKTQILMPLPRTERSNSITDKTFGFNKKTVTSVETITVLEGVLRHLFGLDTLRGETMSSALTEVVIQICDPNSEYEAPPAVIQCFLLKHDRPDLAIEFSRFAGHDSFSTYIQGRVHLAANDSVTAATLFKRAAFGLANQDSRQRSDHRSAGYLDEIEKNLLNAGLPEYYTHIVALFDKEKVYSFVVDFARLALQFIKPGNEDPEATKSRTEMHSRLFYAALQTSRYELAHSTLALFTDNALQHSSLRTLVTKMCESSYASQLIDLPFIGLQDTVDEILAQKCQSIVDVTIGVPYHKILYAWRIKRSDFRGAAAISFERLQRLQQSGNVDELLGEDGLETPITRQYVALINALSCVDPEQAWILSEEPSRKSVGFAKSEAAPAKRRVITLEDIRKAYQEELDRMAAIENNQFTFGGDEMDVL